MKTINKYGGDINQKSKKFILYFSLFFILFTGVIYLFATKNKEAKYTTVVTHIVQNNSKNLIQWDSLTHDLPIQLNAKKNFMDLKAYFTVPYDSTIHLQAVGEGIDYTANSLLLKSWDNDGVELFFDMKNEKLPSFDDKQDDRQYRIIWKTNTIDGRNCDAKNVKIIQQDPSLNQYMMQITFPWKTLGYIKPAIDVALGFEIAVNDNDWGKRHSIVTWNNKTAESWRNTSLYGILQLKGNAVLKPKDSVAYCYKTNYPLSKVSIDKLWATYNYAYPIAKLVGGNVTNKQDLTAKYKALWDKNNLYILVDVQDNIKNLAVVFFDYGWIENMQGKTLWKMNMITTKPAGGSKKNRWVDTLLPIKKGKYVLRYVTDESHSPALWDDTPPISSFYGIKIQYAK